MSLKELLVVLWILPLAASSVQAQVSEATLKKLEARHHKEIEQLKADFNSKLTKLKDRIHELEKRPSKPSAQDEDAELAKLVADAERESRTAVDAVAAHIAGGGAGQLNAFNPRLTVFSDSVLTAVRGTLRNENGEDVGDRFSLRETEMDFRADIDPFAKGVFIFSVEEDSPGQFSISPEEVYATFETLPFNVRGKVGRFRPSFGANNRLHTHDLPQTDRPLPVQSFLGPEGDLEVGAGLEWLVGGLEDPALTLTYQLLNGENDRVLSGSSSDNLAHLVHLSSFFQTSSSSWLDLGASALFGKADPSGDNNSTLLGTDLTFKWRPNDERQLETSLVFQAEGFYLSQDKPGGGTRHRGGAYGMLQYQLDRNWYVGLRGDWTTFPDRASDKDAAAESLWVSYYTTEFLRVRLGVEHLDDPATSADWVLFLQLTFLIGSHPAEPFWVNR